jgi:hypothetical protein
LNRIPAPNQSDVDFRALVTQALQIPSAIALPPSPPSTASSNSSHIQHDLSLAPLSVCLLEVTDYLLLRCMSPAASLFVWDQVFDFLEK